MTSRQLRRRARRHPILAAAAVLLGLVVLVAILRDAPGLVILGAIAAPVAWYAERQARRPVARPATRPLPTPYSPPSWPTPPPAPGMVPTAERDRLASELAAVRAELARTQEALTGALASAEAAWDAAADRPPADRADPVDEDGKRATLLAQPLSGARPLGTR